MQLYIIYGYTIGTNSSVYGAIQTNRGQLIYLDPVWNFRNGFFVSYSINSIKINEFN